MVQPSKYLQIVYKHTISPTTFYDYQGISRFNMTKIKPTMTSSLRVIERPKLSMSKISTICIPPSTHQSQQHSSAGDMEEIHALPQSRPGKMPCIPRAVVTPHENQLEHTIAPPPPPRWSWRIGGSYSCSTMPSLMVHIAMLCILPWTVWKISVLPWVTSKVLKRSLGKRLGSLVFVFLTM